MDALKRFESDDAEWLRGSDSAVESQWIERKLWCDVDALAEQVSAFANGEPPGGLLVVGVSRDGLIEGVDGKGPAVDDRLDKLRGRVDPGTWQHRRLGAGGHTLLYVYVPYSDKRVVCRSDGAAWRRLGQSNHRLTEDELRELRYTRGECSFEDEPCCPFDVAVLDGALASQFLDAMRTANGLSLPLELDPALLNRHLAIRRVDTTHVTHGGILALGAEPARFLAGARLRFLRFEGTVERFGSERNVVKDRWFDGPVPRVIDAFREFMRTQVREFDFLLADGRFAQDPEYPELAWEEAVVNALVHRSYSIRNTPVFVRMFDDRIEVESPGGFPGLVRPDNLFSSPRNPNLANALLYLKLVRLQQEGTRRMQQEMERLGLPPPLYEEIHERTHVLVTLRNDIDRRRPTVAQNAARPNWEEIIELLGDDYAIRRENGVERWENLMDRAGAEPRAVFDAAAKALRDANTNNDLAPRITSLLARAGPAAAPVAVELARDLVSGVFEGDAAYPAVRSSVAEHVGSYVSVVEAAAELVLGSLERLPPGQSPGLRSLSGAFTALGRASRRPLPARAWQERVIRVCVRFPGVRGAGELYQRITGRALLPGAD